MIVFLIVFFGLVGAATLLQIITRMKIVGGNELGIVSGRAGTKKGFRAMSGGRLFVIPFINRFAKLDLTPYTIEVPVESAIAAGVVPLNVKATVSFAIASNEAGRTRAVTRVLVLARDAGKLRKMASDIIEGHLRDSIASITPEQVMKDKDALVARMINVCKGDLENIGLEITTMNIADVDDHRLTGVEEPDLYIALLKRVQSANALTKARVAQAEAKATAVEQQESRRAEVEVRTLENELEKLVAETRVKVMEENQRRTVGVRQAEQNGQARVGGLVVAIESEKQGIGMLSKKFEAEIITKAQAQKEKIVLEAQAAAAMIREQAVAENEQLGRTLDIIKKGGKDGDRTYLIENFARMIEPFAETLKLFPVERLSVITGIEGERPPISAVHPDAAAQGKNELIAAAFEELVRRQRALATGSPGGPKGGGAPTGPSQNAGSPERAPARPSETRSQGR